MLTNIYSWFLVVSMNVILVFVAIEIHKLWKQIIELRANSLSHLEIMKHSSNAAKMDIEAFKVIDKRLSALENNET